MNVRSKTISPLVAWLVNNFACTADNDALAGDLAEHLRKGRTAAWHWKQAIVAIVFSIVAQVRRRPLEILRAVTAGWLVYWPLGYVIFHFGFYELMLVSLSLDDPDLLIGSWAPPVWYHTARFGTTYTFAANAIATALMSAIAVFSGWIVALLFRPNSRPALIILSCTVLLSWVLYSATLGDGVSGAQLPWSAYFWMNSALQTVGILFGGARGEPVAQGFKTNRPQIP